MHVLKKVILNVSDNKPVFKASYFEESKYLSCVTYQITVCQSPTEVFSYRKFRLNTINY
jgi:hypothetical protein